MSALPSRQTCTAALLEAARFLAARDWVPATSGNFSMRLDGQHILITASGKDKARLRAEDLIVVDAQGQPVATTLRPSAETALHLDIYRHHSDAAAVLHTHSRTQSVASMLYAEAGVVRLSGWELLKAIDGVDSHTARLDIPVFPNTQHMSELVTHLHAWRADDRPLRAYLIAGHGLYTWGPDMASARRQIEALDFLLACTMDLEKLTR